VNIYYQNFHLHLYRSEVLNSHRPPSFSEKGYDLPLSNAFELVFESIEPVLKTMKSAKYGYLAIPFESADGLAAYVKELRQHFDYDLEAAGGIVLREKDYSAPLMIKKRGVWDLPKGKVDALELKESAAKREITEETGLTNLRLMQALSPTYHFYLQNGEWYFKTTYWYVFEADGPYKLTPQAEEGITEIQWQRVKEETIDTIYTYDNIRTVLKEFMEESIRQGRR
jgi:8-oxo-dGTP pyrophosphatase MutT (NUDIX family)